ncbi:MAG: pentapeptide repeat-containing protein [Gallionella sp.]|nr:pentapeptide repeat-containing protein [Gallionella sp.]
MTTSFTPTSKVKIQHFDKTGYGYDGTYTREKWREECLNHFEEGAEAFLNWQKSWQNLAENNNLQADFEVQRTFDKKTADKKDDETVYFNGKSHTLDFAGYNFSYCNAEGYQFIYDVIFFLTAFSGTTIFIRTIFSGLAQFEKTHFGGGAIFSNATFVRKANFRGSIIENGAYFNNICTFTGDADFSFSEFKIGITNFQGVIFYGDADFRRAIFKLWANFLKAQFHNQSKFNGAVFEERADFEDSVFENVGHFEGATFNAPTSKIPSFRGVDMGSTRLDFALDLQDDSTFTINYFSKDEIKAAIINIEHLKHLSEEHGQIDQALNFNAMELRAKYLKVIEPLRAESLPWFKRTFKRYTHST